MAKDKKHPPLIQQFIENQLKYPDAIIATEVGGFFEIWQVDDIGYAFKASQLLDTVLTRRNKSDPQSPYMTGFPSHAAQGFFKKLVSLGETVVLVEQNIRGTKADGNKQVAREVTKILSPGTTIDNLTDSQNNFFASVYVENNQMGIALVDVSTGEVKISEMNLNEGKDFIRKMNPREILVVGEFDFIFDSHQLVRKQSSKEKINSLNACGKLLADIYEIKNPSSSETYSIVALDLEFWRFGVLALGNLLNYFMTTEYNSRLLKKISKPEVYNLQNYLVLPSNGIKTLDIVDKDQINSNHTLMSCLNKCKTAMGRRKLNQWLSAPLSNLDLIKKRHDKVEQYIHDNVFLEELKDVYDIARISRKMIISSLMPHEISQLYQSLSIVKDLVFKENGDLGLKLDKIIQYISKNIDITQASCYTDKYEYNFFRGNLEVAVSKSFYQWKESERILEERKFSLELETGAVFKITEKSDSLVLTTTKGMKKNLDAKGIVYEEQAAGLRIIDSLWETYSTSVLGHKTKYLNICKNVWVDFQGQFISSFGKDLIELSDLVAEIDVLSNFAKISLERGYSRPKFVEGQGAFFHFTDMRHPIVEISSNLKESFVANNVSLGGLANTLVIYGANSAGKSTILKSVALNIVMAQIGCFIASGEGSELGVFEAILTRMSSNDSLSEGLSTFTMEMTELQLALNYADKKALFLFDEIGRGTSVEDGEAIAYSTLVYLDKPENKCVTLFATHYHGLYEEIKKVERILIKHVQCYSTNDGKLVFARKLKDGIGEGSYGIEVAKSCGLPNEIIRVAQNYSKDLSQVKQSRYNSSVVGTLCPICNKNPVQETHHLIEQKQGKIKEIVIDGAKKSINDSSNLIMICSSCHDKITKKEINVELRKVLGNTDSISVIISTVNKNE